MSYNYSYSTSTSGGSSTRRQITTKTVTTVSSGGQITKTYRTEGANNLPSTELFKYESRHENLLNSRPPVTSNHIPQPKVTPALSNPTSISQFEKDCLDEHNRYRAQHSSQPLKLNRSLCQYAQEWAQNLASRGGLQHRSNLKYGENLYWASGSEVDGRTAVKNWYSEVKNYRYGHGGFSSGTGHFTQVVWKSSTEMGVGFAKKGNQTFVVANYDPPGNFAGQYQNNVFPKNA